MIREELYDMTTGVKIHKQYVLPSIDLTISFVCGNSRTKRIQSGIFQKLHIFVFQVGLYALNICFLVTRAFRRYLFAKLLFSSAQQSLCCCNTCLLHELVIDFLLKEWYRGFLPLWAPNFSTKKLTKGVLSLGCMKKFSSSA